MKPQKRLWSAKPLGGLEPAMSRSAKVKFSLTRTAVRGHGWEGLADRSQDQKQAMRERVCCEGGVGRPTCLSWTETRHLWTPTRRCFYRYFLLPFSSRLVHSGLERHVPLPRIMAAVALSVATFPGAGQSTWLIGTECVECVRVVVQAFVLIRRTGNSAHEFLDKVSHSHEFRYWKPAVSVSSKYIWACSQRRGFHASSLILLTWA